MVWLYHSHIPVKRRGVISSFKLCLPAFATRRGRGGGEGRHPVVVVLRHVDPELIGSETFVPARLRNPTPDPRPETIFLQRRKPTVYKTPTSDSSTEQI